MYALAVNRTLNGNNRKSWNLETPLIHTENFLVHLEQEKSFFEDSRCLFKSLARENDFSHFEQKNLFLSDACVFLWRHRDDLLANSFMHTWNKFCKLILEYLWNKQRSQLTKWKQGKFSTLSRYWLFYPNNLMFHVTLSNLL